MESAQATSSKINKGGIRKKMSKLEINPDKELLEDDLLKDVDMVKQDIQLQDAAEKIKKLEEELESLKKIVAKKKENEEKGKKENEEKGKKENEDEKKKEEEKSKMENRFTRPRWNRGGRGQRSNKNSYKKRGGRTFIFNM
ncbi:uncharacterized protein [Linepithema humile]|uniref:uncharacterized protein n=1 Tax=Linepithema humile TaxID=83485 RepID=UPI00351E10F0